MAGIGFELRKLFHEEGLINNIKAYAYSSLTTVGPMILCMTLIIALQRIMNAEGGTYLDWELYIATVSYCFIFSIVFTSGISMVLTRYVADMLYEKKYKRLMSSYYGSLVIMLPIVSVIAIWFLSGVSANLAYKLAAYFFFILLVMVWIQGVYLSALKDYIRIARGFIIGSFFALLCGWLAFKFTELEATTAALVGLDLGFIVIVILSTHHFEQRFPKADHKYFFEFVHYLKKYSSLFFAGCFIYSGVYLHNFVYWLSPRGVEVADRYLVMPFYDLPVYFAFMSVMPTLVMFVVSVETSFYEKFRVYYLNILNGGTIQDISVAKKKMQKTLTKEISFLMEVQLLFTILAIALGIKFLPTIGFTMEQLDLFIILALAYFLFILLFVLTHVLMYFDDRKGVLSIGFVFVILNIGFTYWMLQIGFDGLGMFIASFITLALVIVRLLYVLRNIDYFTFCAQPINQKVQKKSKSLFNKPGVALSIIAIMTLLLSACSTLDIAEPGESVSEEVVNRAPMPTSVDSRLIEDKRVYERDDDSSLKTLYVTVLPYTETEESFDWYAMNRQTDKATAKELNVIVEEGLSDDKGPRSGMFGYGTQQANGIIKIRGNSTWYSSQKSYKINLMPDAGLFLDQRSLNLNKHTGDFSRIRNKLSFDLMETIPNLTSLRTQFVHLYVKDLSTGSKDVKYEDYGLFTHVEQTNERFLKAHLLDPNANLYKAINFEYYRYEDEIKNVDDPGYDKVLFDTILESKGREDHTKLIEMLEAVNDYGIPIDETVEKYFDEENLLTWTATNLLVDNTDTTSQNFYLYSPLNSEKWYLLPWDYDDNFNRAPDRQPFQIGTSLYWGTTLHSRYFRNYSNVEKLIAKMEELSAYINKETITAQIDKYRDVVEPFLHRMPDNRFLSEELSKYDEELQKLIDTPELGLKRFYEDLERPKPFYINDVEYEDNKIKLSWGIAFDFQNDKLFYDLIIAKDIELTQIVYQANNLVTTNDEVNILSPGKYYLQVIARDSKGNTQYPFDHIRGSSYVAYFGIKEFEVE